MTDTVLVRPRHGLILPDVPAKGVEMPREEAEAMIASRLVEPVPIHPSTPPKTRSTKK
jgi:hypothetical protein